MPRRSATAYALSLLGRKARSRSEIVEKLRSKQYSESEIESAIAWLEKNRLIDDLTFSQIYAEDKVKIYRRGRHRIALELLQKGIDKGLIEQVMAGIDPEMELAAARTLLESKSRQWRQLTDRQRFGRSVALLKRRGFSGSIIRQVLGEN
jgi:regulatory protein